MRCIRSPKCGKPNNIMSSLRPLDRASLLQRPKFRNFAIQMSCAASHGPVALTMQQNTILNHRYKWVFCLDSRTHTPSSLCSL